MNQMLICSVLVGLAANFGMCQETIVPTTLSESTQPGYSVMRLFLKSSNPEDFAPLTRQERLRIYLARTYGVGSTLGAATVGGFEQWINTPSEWGHGSEGYRKRFANAYATHIIQGTTEYGFSALLDEDNRYRRSLETGFWRRSKHAITGAFSSTDDAGQQHFSYSRVGAAGTAAFVRRTWQPHSTDGVGDAAASFGILLSAQVGQNLFREFWPDLKGRLFKKK